MTMTMTAIVIYTMAHGPRRLAADPTDACLMRTPIRRLTPARTEGTPRAHAQCMLLTMLVVSADEREQLLRWSRRAKTAQALAMRAKIVFACAGGLTNVEVAEKLRVTPGG